MNVFISVPMRGLTDQQIDDEMELVAKVAQAYFPLGKLHFVSNFMTEPDEMPNTVKKESVWHLGEAIKCISTCDAIMCPSNTAICIPPDKEKKEEDFELDKPFSVIIHAKGCEIERSVAMEYDIPIYYYDESILEDFLKGEFHDKEE